MTRLITAIRAAALDLVQSTPGCAVDTACDLDRYVLGTGYDQAPSPHASTADLLYVYAANLRNAGGAGLHPERQGEMVRGALGSLIVSNRIQPFSLRILAQGCLDYLERTGINLTSNDSAYRDELRKMANGHEATSKLAQHLGSVTAFSDFLCTKFEGNAENYSASFDAFGAHPESVLQKLNEISGFKGIGIATGLNFLKDSQAPRFSEKRLCDVKTHPVAFLVKPDRHVMRLMFFITGRFARTGRPAENLWNMNEKEVSSLYQSCAPGDDWFTTAPPAACSVPKPRSPLWAACRDIHAWAAAEAVAPLEIDRLLYLIGSGNYRHSLADPQPVRYRKACERIAAA